MALQDPTFAEDDDFWTVEPTAPAAAVAPTPYGGPVPQGYSQADVEDFLRRNPGDEHRVMEALTRSAPAAQPQTFSFAQPSQSGAPDSIKPYDKTFSFDASQAGKSDAFKVRFDKAMEAIQRSGAAKGSLLTKRTLDALQSEAVGLAGQDVEGEYYRQSDTFDRNEGVFRNNERDRFNSQRTNRVDDFSFMDRNRVFDRGVLESDRNFGRGVLESDRAFDYGKARDTQNDLWRFVDYGYGSGSYAR